MDIKCVKVGYLECNCYVLIKNNKALVIDPGSEANKIFKLIGDNQLLGIIITHYHFDHIGALDDIKEKYNVNVYDRYNMIEGDNSIGNFDFEVIYTPGHKEDLITLYFKEYNCMFVGDFIFKDSIGRCDLAGGNMDDMNKSICKIKKYKNDTILYPGHGDKTTLGYEKKNNVYF